MEACPVCKQKTLWQEHTVDVLVAWYTCAYCGYQFSRKGVTKVGYPTYDELADMQKEIYDNSARHGFWAAETDPRIKLFLIVTEVTEAFEAIRNNNEVSDHLPGVPMLAEELADIIIRTLDLAEHEGFDMHDIIKQKMAFNESRPIRHNKLF